MVYITNTLANKIVDNCDIKVTAKDVQTICNAFFETIIVNLKECSEDETVTFNNVIKFKKVLRKPRDYKNSKTGEITTKEAYYTITASPLENLKSSINEEVSE